MRPYHCFYNENLMGIIRYEELPPFKTFLVSDHATTTIASKLSNKYLITLIL